MEPTFRSLADFARRFLLHMRLPFNYVLSPLFVWGGLVSAGAPGRSFWIGLVAFHVFLYGGTNMFNSYYDRDEGPIGGLEEPPPVDASLFWGSLALKGLGLVLAALLGGAFLACYLAFVAYSISYSHPAIRIKRRPVASAVTVFVGQGIVGYAAGWAAAAGDLSGILQPTALAGGLGGAVMVSGLYPLTQIYQIEEDTRRGDLTLAGWLGLPSTFRYVSGLLLIGLACVGYVFWQRTWLLSAAGWGAYMLVLALVLAHLRRTFPRLSPRDVYRRVMTLQYCSSTALLLLLGLQWLWQARP